MVEPIGHVDFYPNGGNSQPGCSMLDVPVGMDSMVDPDRMADAFGRHMVACSHMRAVELYIESLDHARNPDTTCPLVGYECKSYDQFKEVSKRTSLFTNSFKLEKIIFKGGYSLK